MGDYTPQSRSEEILYDTIHSLEYTERPQSRIEELLLELKAVIEGGGGTKDYEELTHKPSIGGVELSGDKSLADLGAASEGAVAAKANQSDIAPTFSDATAYTAGGVVYHDGSLYRFTADHSAGAWDSADVEPVTVDDLVDGLKPVDSITNGDMRPVTSNAVADTIAALSLADRDLLDWDNSVDIASGTDYTPSKNGILIAHGVAIGDTPTGTLRDLTLGYTVANTYSAGSGTGMGCNIIAVKGHKYRLYVFNVTMTLTFIPFK